MINDIILGILAYFTIRLVFKIDRYFRQNEADYLKRTHEYAKVMVPNYDKDIDYEPKPVKRIRDYWFELDRRQSCQYFDIKPYLKIRNQNFKKNFNFKNQQLKTWPTRNIRSNI